mgnify:CR=1 FL=1
MIHDRINLPSFLQLTHKKGRYISGPFISTYIKIDYRMVFSTGQIKSDNVFEPAAVG